MIEKHYSRSINVTSPANYFEKWYAALWRRHFEHVADPSKLQRVLAEELSTVGAKIDVVEHYGYTVTFNNDADYTVFVLRNS
jgi:hypothetical protein